MNDLYIDLETFSCVSIGDAGAHKYVEDDSFEILLFAYSLNGNPVRVIDVASGEQVPGWLVSALTDGAYKKHAYNAAFEFACLSKVYGAMIPEQWQCEMVHGMYAGYTAGLDATGKALGLPQEKQKLATGKALIRYFCMPCRPTRANGARMRNRPQDDPEKWALFKEYNRQDVVTEIEIEKRLQAFPVPASVWAQWHTDLKINTRGVAVDTALTQGALYIGAQTRNALIAEAQAISGLENPNSVSQLLSWLSEAGTDVENLRKETVADLLSQGGHPENVRRLLEIRQELGKTSIKKYDAIMNCECKDGRVRGLLQFYGANRTGRWAGRLVQVQNLPRTYMEMLDLARGLIKAGKGDALRLIYGSVPDALSQMIRTAFIATPGNVLIDADFSAIEARVISWLAGEEWRLNVFRTTGKIYEASAAMIYNVPVETIVKGHENYKLRQRGKVAELALGYQGGVGAMRRMDVSHALDEMSDEEVQEIVNQWRGANSKIRQLWGDFEAVATYVIQNGGAFTSHGLTFAREYDANNGRQVMSILLPSGRKLFYVEPTVTENRWGRPSLGYLGVDQTTKKWERIETYGGKLTENVVQAIARDCLAFAIENLEARGYPVVFHVHDEVVIDMPRYADDAKMLKDVTEIMTVPAPWAAGLPLNADGWVGTYFKKD